MKFNFEFDFKQACTTLTLILCAMFFTGILVFLDSGNLAAIIGCCFGLCIFAFLAAGLIGGDNNDR